MNTEKTAAESKAIGDEPLPGYRLIEPLGSGGFGEVWKCEAPGGLLKAIKFVQSANMSLHAPDAGKNNSAILEFQAIQRIKDVRHPFLLSLDRVEVLNGELLLVMELADQNLADRFAECRTAGQTGIGRDELLGYLTEAAEALDVMNIKHGLQHLDIKPANLFVVGNHLKVADFGLVNSLEELPADGPPKHLGGLTPLYVAPEMLRGKMSRHSDQYSLAIVYQELLTGTLPFAGQNARKIMLAHLMEEPDLSALSDADRPLVRRALAKDPDRRFPSCLHFVQALVFGVDPDAAAPPPASRPMARFLHTPPTEVPSESRNVTVVTKRPQIPAAFTGKKGLAVTLSPAAPPSTVSAMREAKRDDRPNAATGLTLPGYQLLAQVHRGSLGELYAARDEDGQERQIRYLPNGGDDTEMDRWLLTRLGSLDDPVLPRLEVKRLANGRLVLIADAVRETLQDRFDDCVAGGMKGIPRVELLRDVATAGEALDAIHRGERLHHLGLNPRALLLDDGRVRLGEFGLAQLLWLPHWQTAAHPHRRYAAPELLRGAPHLTSDAYSLALIFAEMLTGVHPLPHRPRSRAASAAPARPNLDWLPAADRPVLARALDPDPDKRFPNCVALLDALGAPVSRSGLVVRPSSANELPFIRPFAGLFGGGEQRAAGVPSIQRIVTQVVLTEASGVTLGMAQKLPYLQRGNHTLETRFPVRLLPGMVRLKVDAFCEKWEAKVVEQTERSFALRLQESGNFWQRCLGQKAGLEVRLVLQPTRDANVHTSEATATVQPFGGIQHLSAQKVREAGPLLLVSMRDDLQNTPDQRGQVRWPCSPAIDVYPIDADGKVTDVMAGKCKDISFNGIAFTTVQRFPGPIAYLHLKTFPELAPFVLLARVARAEPCDGGYKIGAAFATAGLDKV